MAPVTTAKLKKANSNASFSSLMPDHWHYRLYVLGLAMVAVGLPISKALMSIGGLLLAANFVLSASLKTSAKAILGRASVALFVLVFVWLACGLLWTDYNLPAALSDLRIKLPLLLFPVVLFLSPSLKRTHFALVLGLFCASILITSFVSTYRFMEIIDVPGADFRSISIFTSHIRYGLMVCMAFLILLNFAWNESTNGRLRVLYIIAALWLSIFIFILQSMTGIVIWLFSSYAMLFYTITYIERRLFRRISITILIAIPFATLGYVASEVDAFYPDEYPTLESLSTHSPSGEAYSHDFKNLTLENGNLVWINVAFKELETTWAERSAIRFYGGKDAKGQFVYSTVLRYMTSKGLKKDREGVLALTDADVKAIEMGITNSRFLEQAPISNRIYEIIWEFDRVRRGENPGGNSVAQRFEFWRAGWHLFKEHWLMGVGTGDVKHGFKAAYESIDTQLVEEYQLKTHNQVLSMALTVGLIGALIFIGSLLMPFFTEPRAHSFLYVAFSLIAFLSFMNEDTLDTQAGVTFYAFFNAFFLYASLPKPTDS